MRSDRNSVSTDIRAAETSEEGGYGMFLTDGVRYLFWASSDNAGFFKNNEMAGECWGGADEVCHV